MSITRSLRKTVVRRKVKGGIGTGMKVEYGASVVVIIPQAVRGDNG